MLVMFLYPTSYKSQLKDEFPHPTTRTFSLGLIYLCNIPHNSPYSPYLKYKNASVRYSIVRKYYYKVPYYTSNYFHTIYLTIQMLSCHAFWKIYPSILFVEILHDSSEVIPYLSLYLSNNWSEHLKYFHCWNNWTQIVRT